MIEWTRDERPHTAGMLGRVGKCPSVFSVHWDGINGSRNADGPYILGCRLPGIQGSDRQLQDRGRRDGASRPHPREVDRRRRASPQRKAAGLTRLELYAHPEDHAEIKLVAARLQRKRAKDKKT